MYETLKYTIICIYFWDKMFIFINDNIMDLLYKRYILFTNVYKFANILSPLVHYLSTHGGSV